MAGKKSRKAAVSESDSDSGPDDRNPPANAAKKQKTDEEGKPKKNEAGEYVFELSKMRNVSVKEFKGRVLVNIREFYEDKNSGELRPGKKGIALSADQWNRLKEHMNDIDAAIKECA
ncbi:activated RNA polymerase II transcriptional coactivator p15 [Galendromus occidentalis]|uniref:Activated RNA polymerase II transcriptional coactivator p15 n=1 Tax=Galendromus occidentalis TaxID=34638 RepID=A0AAJ6QX19_9ACAR|nr:activated RNA polymerase II transcriptional coactivator p15 [Galendromus occidentalis]